MAMFSCPECTKQISDKALSCPNCGVPISESTQPVENTPSHMNVTRSGTKWEGLGFMIIIIGMISAMAGWQYGGALLGLGFIIFIVGRFQ